MDVLALQGAVWAGTRAATLPGWVLVGEAGLILHVGQAPAILEGPFRHIAGAWIGPALVDGHVHLAFAEPAEVLAAGVGACRDLGAPLEQAIAWRQNNDLVTAVAGEILTATGGYPTRTWGSSGYGCGIDGPEEAVDAVRRLVASGTDLVKLALEPSGGAPVPDLETCHAVVAAAHAHGLAVTCHALSVAMVERALDAGVDELAHTPTEALPPDVIDRIANSGLTVVSTIDTHVLGGAWSVLDNAAQLVAAGVPLVYGTDLGNEGTSAGPSVAELEHLGASGLGREGALRAATEGSGRLAGLAGRVDATVEPGARTVLVVLPADPLDEPTAWEAPIAVISQGHVVGGSEFRAHG